MAMKNRRPYKNLPIERLRMLNSLHHGPFGSAEERRLIANEFTTRASRSDRLRNLKRLGYFAATPVSVTLEPAEGGE